MTDCPDQTDLDDHAATKPGAAQVSDDALIAAAIATGPQQRWAFSALWQRHHAYIRAFCARRLQGLAGADDVTQNVALKAFRCLGQFERRCRFRTWLTAIAITQCSDFRRREARQKDIARQQFAMHCGAWDREAIGEHEDRARIARSTRALRALPWRAREVLVMRFYRELSLEDMSNELNLGLSGTKMRLYRSIERLRASYFELDALETQGSHARHGHRGSSRRAPASAANLTARRTADAATT